MNAIFVFGSNLAGKHGRGAARYALEHQGAIYGQGIGIQGSSYGIPTKDEKIKTLPLPIIQEFINSFLRFASENSHMVFNVTRIGCGLAGYTDAEMAPFFRMPTKNCFYPQEWRPFLGESFKYHDLH